MKTSDGGSNWSSEAVPSGTGLRSVSCATTTTCFIAANNGVFKTVDGGQSWTQSTALTGFVIDCPTTGSCYVLNRPANGSTTVMSTQDGGTTWVVVDPTTSGAAGTYFAIACAAATTCDVVGYQGRIITTTSGGATWTVVSRGPLTNFSGVSCPSVATCVVVGASGTILATTDSGASWIAETSGTTADLTGVSCASVSACTAVGTTVAVSTVDGGATWTAHPFPFGAAPHVSCPTMLICYADADVSQGSAGYAGTVYGSKDGGTSWTSLLAVTSGSAPVFLDIDCPGANSCFASGQGIFRTTDGGASWAVVTALSTGNRLQLSCPTLSICYAIGGIPESSQNPGEAFRTTDSGSHWSTLSLPSFDTGFRGTSGTVTPRMISCPNATSCYLLAGWFNTAPILSLGTADGGANWTLAEAADSSLSELGTRGLSCASLTACVAVGNAGMILTLARPVFRSGDTGRPWTGGSDAVGVSAPTTDAYFAEGYTGGNFEEYLTVQNPAAAQTLTVDYLLGDGTDLTKTYALAATSRTTINVNDEVGQGLEVSMHLHAANPIVAERPMYFDFGGITGGHDAAGAPAPSKRFYFAEGFTAAGFNEYLSLMNPGAVAASVTVTYLYDGGTAPKPVVHTVAPHSRFSIHVNDTAEAGPGRAVSMQVTADQPIVAERPMYFNYAGETGGSDVVGATSLLTDMNLAEGHVGQGFDEYLTLLNPNAQSATATVTYYLKGGQPVLRTVPLAPTSRTTVHVNDVLPSGTDPSVHVHSTLPILVERPMYFTYNGWTGGHDAMAVPDSALSTTLNFAEGFVSPNFVEYYTILNPNPNPAQVTITYYDAAGTAHPKPITVPAQSRFTELANNDLPINTPNSAVITSNLPILAERPMYFSY